MSNDVFFNTEPIKAIKSEDLLRDMANMQKKLRDKYERPVTTTCIKPARNQGKLQAVEASFPKDWNGMSIGSPPPGHIGEAGSPKYDPKLGYWYPNKFEAAWLNAWENEYNEEKLFDKWKLSIDGKPIEIMNNTATNKTPHTQQVSGNRISEVLHVNGRGLSGTLAVEDETATLRVEIPGVPLERVEVKIVDTTLRIRVYGEKKEELDYRTMDVNTRQLDVLLADGEDVEDVKLALGVLTVVIDRGRAVELLTVREDD